MFNKVILVGNLTRDCELRYLPSGSAVCTTGIATNRKFKNQMGEQKEEVCFIDITFFGRTAEIANQYLRRGAKVLVEGRLKLDQWTDQNGGKRSKHSVTVDNLQMLDSKGSNNNADGNSNYNQPQQNSGYNSAPAAQPSYQQETQPSHQQPQAPKHTGHEIPDIDIDEDEIPF
ncbi:single-stranded DNA-binding protein [Sulfurospirillum arcachonense]|uniref:single-stranded DNA-binding protein n=1 Tax=Sulfurospirillum arcachonense TaxID=57666 RepID=UPI00046AFAA5|nr:single-stranded DNA-binding protein [Sulfurospirillum arcachonense]